MQAVKIHHLALMASKVSRQFMAIAHSDELQEPRERRPWEVLDFIKAHLKELDAKEASEAELAVLHEQFDSNARRVQLRCLQQLRMSTELVNVIRIGSSRMVNRLRAPRLSDAEGAALGACTTWLSLVERMELSISDDAWREHILRAVGERGALKSARLIKVWGGGTPSNASLIVLAHAAAHDAALPACVELDFFGPLLDKDYPASSRLGRPSAATRGPPINGQALTALADCLAAGRLPSLRSLVLSVGPSVDVTLPLPSPMLDFSTVAAAVSAVISGPVLLTFGNHENELVAPTAAHTRLQKVCASRSPPVSLCWGGCAPNDVQLRAGCAVDVQLRQSITAAQAYAASDEVDEIG